MGLSVRGAFVRARVTGRAGGSAKGRERNIGRRTSIVVAAAANGARVSVSRSGGMEKPRREDDSAGARAAVVVYRFHQPDDEVEEVKGEPSFSCDGFDVFDADGKSDDVDDAARSRSIDEPEPVVKVAEQSTRSPKALMADFLDKQAKDKTAEAPSAPKRGASARKSGKAARGTLAEDPVASNEAPKESVAGTGKKAKSVEVHDPVMQASAMTRAGELGLYEAEFDVTAGIYSTGITFKPGPDGRPQVCTVRKGGSAKGVVEPGDVLIETSMTIMVKDGRGKAKFGVPERVFHDSKDSSFDACMEAMRTNNELLTLRLCRDYEPQGVIPMQAGSGVDSWLEAREELEGGAEGEQSGKAWAARNAAEVPLK